MVIHSGMNGMAISPRAASESAETANAGQAAAAAGRISGSATATVARQTGCREHAPAESGRRVSKSQFARSQGYGGFAAAMSQHRAAEAQHRALEAQHRALMAQSRQMERMFRGGFPW